ncbi:hypothetical protein E3N88_13488 [Mikania micrantha]|uniref:Reverse transcriptase zinc-binding domain-containing protein n=1 Tax=Mikania micrantha TaxID=192012 RepID=A0A5N6P9V3_9ASTR|nr:hypothetical protein E3N88_13488 [Mikania micrantha]
MWLPSNVLEKERNLSSEEKKKILECKGKIWEWENMNCKDMQQKAKVRWVECGDDNSAYFHRLINCHKASNRINGLMFDGDWVTEPKTIKEKRFSHEEVKNADWEYGGEQIDSGEKADWRCLEECVCVENELAKRNVDINSKLECVVRNDNKTFFWTNKWLQEGVLREFYERISKLAKNKMAMVADNFSRVGNTTLWG